MGINGLHKGLTFCTKQVNIRDFSGQTIAIDTSSWLYKSVYSVSEKYVETTEKGCLDPHCVRVSSKYISSRCRELLQSFRIAKIFLVMDGKRCPLKADTNGEREQRRQQNMKEAREHKQRGRRDKAEEKYKSCIKIRDEFTNAVMKEVSKSFNRDARVQLVWSPYEADSQLVKLCIDRIADAVVTEVSLSRWLLSWSNPFQLLTLTSQIISIFQRILMFLFTLQPHIMPSQYFSSWIEEPVAAILYVWTGFYHRLLRIQK